MTERPIMKDTVVEYTPQAHPSRTIQYSMLYPAGYATIVYGNMWWYIIHILSHDRTATGLFSSGSKECTVISIDEEKCSDPSINL